MTTTPRRTARWLFLATLSTLLLAACSTGAADDSSHEGADTTGAPTTTGLKAAPGGIDFGAGSSVDLGAGWRVEPCESGPPLFCVRLDGETQGTFELMSQPASGYSEIRRVLDAGGDHQAALQAEAQAFLDIFAADRPAGCGPAYEVKPFGPRPTTLAATPGISYGFEGHQDGRLVERVRQFSTIVDGVVHSISLSAIDDGSCMDDGELSELSVAQLADLETALVGVIAASRLP